MKKTKRIKRQISRTIEGKHSAEYLTDLILKEIEVRDEKIEELSRRIEIMNRKVLPIDARYLEMLIVDSDNSKITINPCTSRVTLKISHKSSYKVREDLYELVEMIRKDDTLPPVTLRGKVIWRDKFYEVTLMSESKKFSFNYKYQPE
jgi:hypothetical protein